MTTLADRDYERDQAERRIIWFVASRTRCAAMDQEKAARAPVERLKILADEADIKALGEAAADPLVKTS